MLRKIRFKIPSSGESVEIQAARFSSPSSPHPSFEGLRDLALSGPGPPQHMRKNPTTDQLEIPI